MRDLDGLSDHRAITAIHAPQEAPSRQHKQTTVKTRLWKEASTEDIVKLVKEEMQKRIHRRNTRRRRDEQVVRLPGPRCWGRRYAHKALSRKSGEETLEELLDDWDHAWGTVKKELVPEKRIKIGKPRRARWFKKEIKEGIKERQRKEEATRSGIEGPQLDKALEELKQVTKGVRKRIVNAKREYVQKEISALPEGRITDRKEGWCVWDRLMGRKKKCKAEPVGSADKCNDAFLQKVEKIREPLLQFPVRSPEERQVAELRGFKPVTADDVKKALSRDKGTKSVGIDGIPMSVLKRVGPHLSEEIASIANASIRERRWPKQWKRAEIVPIWKRKGNRKEAKYYRPVAMLPAIARLVERIIAEQLKEHIRRNSILPKIQRGFRAGHSTESALIQLVDSVASAMDDGESVIVASLDAAGAFDTLDRDVIMMKLEGVCGIRGEAAEWIKRYLQDRYQRVRKSNGTSSWKENPWGVPQGSVLGPLLFVLYCADIMDTVKSAEIVQYADDVTLVAAADTLEDAVEKMNRALAEFQQYATGSRIAAE
eukprot:gene17800-biopygen12348